MGRAGPNCFRVLPWRRFPPRTGIQFSLTGCPILVLAEAEGGLSWHVTPRQTQFKYKRVKTQIFLLHTFECGKLRESVSYRPTSYIMVILVSEDLEFSSSKWKSGTILLCVRRKTTFEDRRSLVRLELTTTPSKLPLWGQALQTSW